MSERLTPQERIRNKKDFLRLYKNGNRYRGHYFNLVYLTSELPFSRMGVVVSKKVGHAVTRNKIKRRIRYLFRRNKELLPAPLDMVIIATRAIADASWREIQEQFLEAVKRISGKGQSH